VQLVHGLHPPCPTGSDRQLAHMPRVKAYSVEEQLGWDELPAELSRRAAGGAGRRCAGARTPEDAPESRRRRAGGRERRAAFNSAAVRRDTLPPWSAAHAYTNLYGPKAAEKTVTATVAGNVRVTEVGKDYDTHHIVLDFGAMPFPVLEGQSIGIVPPGTDAHGRPHHARQYSIASPRNGERPGYNNLSLTVKRVLEDHQGNPVRGVASNYMCDLQVGDRCR
jgi:benzoyl-CoA 2,3-epoxidase subunit A